LKKVVILFIVFFLVLNYFISFNIIQADNLEENITLNVYNWGNNIADGTDGSVNINSEFTKRTGIKINYTNYSDNESLFAKLSSGGTSYDVIFPSEYMVNKMRKKNMLKELDLNLIPNIKYMDKEFLNKEYDPGNKFSVPYNWGLLGIFYNKNLLKENPENLEWSSLWDVKYAGNILMFDNSPRDVFGIAQLKLKTSLNTVDPEDWKKCAEELKKQRPLVQAFAMDGIVDKLQNGEAILAPYYSDYSFINKENFNVGFMIPKSGTNLFTNLMCIPVSSKHVKEAHEYINFLCDPEIALKNIEHTGYNTPESIVKEKLDPEVSGNKYLYPDENFLKEKVQVYKSMPDEINLLAADLWVQTRTDTRKSNALYFLLVIGGFAIFYLGIVLFKNSEKSEN